MKRYPGVTPFLEEQQNLFFGRENDINKLSDLISLRKQVLLYSKSGIGKSSLLNAGVLPQLKNTYTIVKVRFLAYNEVNNQTPVKTIIDALIERIPDFASLPNSIIDELEENTNITKTLWFTFKKVSLAKNCEFLIIFDQFEELFYYPQEQINDFKNQFHELTNVDIPDTFVRLIEKKLEIEEHKQIDSLYDELKVKTIFAIRSVKLSLLNKLTDKIHDIQKVCYELKPLSREQVISAIQKPAELEKKEIFDSVSFVFDEKAYEKIIGYLINNNNRNEIETPQLQIICEYCENLIIKNENKYSITAKDLDNIAEVFENYIDTCFKASKLSDQESRNIEKLIYEDLRPNQIRLTPPYELIKSTYLIK